MFSVLWDKKVSRKSRDFPLLSRLFAVIGGGNHDFFAVIGGGKKGSPTKVFGTVRKSIFDKIVIHHLMQFLYSRKFLKKRVLLGVLPVLWDKKASRESRDISLLAIKISDKRKFWKMKGSPTKLFGTVRKLFFRQNCDTPSYAIFLIQKFSGKRSA